MKSYGKTTHRCWEDEAMCYPHSLKNFCYTVEGHIPIITKTEHTRIMVLLLIAR